MNTKQTKSRSMLLLAMLLIVSTVCSWAGNPERIKRKEYSQSFSVSLSDQLLINNRYGNITVTHWNKNEALIRVEIEAKAETEEAAQATLDRVQIELKKSGNTVSGVTSLKEQRWNNNSNERFTINYYISIPSKLAINLSQKYGNINLPNNNEGRSTIQVKYGNLNAGSFTEHLHVEAKYGNVDINNVVNVGLDLGYCGNVSIGNAKLINAENKYSNMSVKKCTQINVENKYGNLKIESADKAQMDIKYSEVSFGAINSELLVGELAYSTLTVKELSANFKQVKVDARYGNLNLSIPSGASFKVSAENMKYSNHNVSGFNVTNKSTEDKVNHYYEINGGKKGTIYFDGNNYSNINVKALK